MERNKTDHLLNLPNFLIGNSLKCDMEKDLMIVPSDKIYADLKGIVIATEEFFVMSSFQTNVWHKTRDNKYFVKIYNNAYISA